MQVKINGLGTALGVKHLFKFFGGTLQRVEGYMSWCALGGGEYWLQCVTGVPCPQRCLYLCVACTGQLDPWCSSLPLQEVSDVSETSHQGAR